MHKVEGQKMSKPRGPDVQGHIGALPLELPLYTRWHKGLGKKSTVIDADLDIKCNSNEASCEIRRGFNI